MPTDSQTHHPTGARMVFLGPSRPSAHADRDARIWAARKAGATLREAGAPYGLSVERTRTICVQQDQRELTRRIGEPLLDVIQQLRRRKFAGASNG